MVQEVIVASYCFDFTVWRAPPDNRHESCKQFRSGTDSAFLWLSLSSDMPRSVGATSICGPCTNDYEEPIAAPRMTAAENPGEDAGTARARDRNRQHTST